MNLPFSLLDILERLIPGGIFLAVLMIFPPALPDPALLGKTAISNGLFMSSLFVAASFALGVLFNIGIGINRRFEDWLLDRRNDVDLSLLGSGTLAKPYRQRFGHDIDRDGWKLCYGIAQKSGFGIKVDLFSSLDLFCRSMATCGFVLGLIYVAKALSSGAIFYWWIAVLSLAGAGLFVRGARQFSYAFAAAIYESFMTWHYVGDLGGSQPTISSGEKK